MSHFNRRIIVWFLLACAILCGLSFATYRSIQSLLRQNGWVEHTYQVLALLDETTIHMKDVQSAARSYVLINAPRFRDAARESQKDVFRTLDDLAAQVADNPMQVARLPVLREAASEVIAYAQETLAIYEKEGQEAAVRHIATGIGQQRMDLAQQRLATFRATELELLGARKRHVEEAVGITLIAGAAGLLICMLIMAMVFWLINRETKRRATTEASLRDAVAHTEIINEERRQVAQMGDFLQSCRTNDEVYQLVQQNIPHMFPGTHGALGITSNSRNLIDVATTWGEEHSTLTQFPPEDCWAMRRGKIHAITAGAPEPDCSHLTARMPELVCMPLMAHGETLGVFYIATITRGYFSERRLLLLRTVCEQISLALANMKLQETLRLQTLRDPLTQLYNRRYMESSLERELLRARRNKQALAVLMLDIDHFKRFNDTFGHDAGDALLKEFGKLLQRNVRGEDIACRYGGEEFIIILPTASLEIAQKRAEKILTDTRALEVTHHHQPLGTVTASIGLAVFPGHGEEVEPLVKAADKALYTAKHQGRDRFITAAS